MADLQPESDCGPAKVRRIFIQTSLMAPAKCAPVRILEPEKLLATIPGVRTQSIVQGYVKDRGETGEEKVHIWQRAIFRPPDCFESLRERIDQGYLLIAEIDDDPDGYPEHRQNNYLTFRACHAVQTSTPALAEVLRPHNPHVQVFANQLAELPPPRVYGDAGPVTLVFAAINRGPDWQPLMPALNRGLARFGERVQVRVVGDFPFFYALQTPLKTFEDYCDYERYQEILRGSDVALLPLNPTRFNALKSDLKFIECAGQGVAVLASSTVYQDSIEPEVTGVLFRSEMEFETQLQRLIEDRELRQRLAGNAYRDIAQSRLLSQHYRERYDWYVALLDRLPQLTAELKVRVPEMFLL